MSERGSYYPTGEEFANVIRSLIARARHDCAEAIDASKAAAFRASDANLEIARLEAALRAYQGAEPVVDEGDNDGD